jgi:hypothetical protein
LFVSPEGDVGIGESLAGPDRQLALSVSNDVPLRHLAGVSNATVSKK